jgi:hypothetical protein
MQHPHEVDMVLAVLDSREMAVYGRDLLRHIVADEEEVQASVARIPIGRPESVDVLKVYFAACGSVTWAKVLDAGRQSPGMEPTFKGSECPFRFFVLMARHTTRSRAPAHHRPTGDRVGPQRAA